MMDSLSSQFSQYSQSSQYSQASEVSPSSQSKQPSESQFQQPHSFQHPSQFQQPYPFQFTPPHQFPQVYPFPYAPQCQVPPQFQPSPVEAQSQSRKISKATKGPKGSQKRRTRNFQAKEDEAVVRAWLGVSEDGVTGSGQPRNKLWTRIYNIFNEILGIQNPDEDEDRTPNALSCRWQAIQHQVNKFCGYFATIDRNPRSGTNVDDRVGDAKKVFRSLEGCDFKMEQLWIILKDHPKWNEKVVSKNKQNVKVTPPPRFDGSSPNLESINSDSTTPTTPGSSIQLDSDGDTFTLGSDEDGVQRPVMGRKKSKERKKKGITIDGSSSIMKEFMVKFDASVQQQLAQAEKEMKIKEDMHRKEQELKERHLNQKDEILRQKNEILIQQAQQLNVIGQKVRQKQWMEEKEILFKDLRDMTPHQT